MPLFPHPQKGLPGGGVCHVSRSLRTLSPFAERQLRVGELLHPQDHQRSRGLQGSQGPLRGGSGTTEPDPDSRNLVTPPDDPLSPTPPQTLQAPTVRHLRDGSARLDFGEEEIGELGAAWAWETGVLSGHRWGLWGLRGGEWAGADGSDWTRQPLQSRGGGRGGGAEEQEALGRGSTQQDSWTPTSLSQLESSSEPCSARQGVGRPEWRGQGCSCMGWEGPALPPRVPRGLARLGFPTAAPAGGSGLRWSGPRGLGRCRVGEGGQLESRAEFRDSPFFSPKPGAVPGGLCSLQALGSGESHIHMGGLGRSSFRLGPRG